MYYSVDIDHLRNIPIRQVAEQLNMKISGRRCFCPDPECPDNASKKPGAVISTDRNTIHCFVCGRTFSPWTLTAAAVFGMGKEESYSADGINMVGEYMGLTMGYGGIRAKDKKEENPFPKMPYLRFTGEALPVPLYRLLGLSKNPLQRVSIRDGDGACGYSLPQEDAVRMLFERCMEAAENAYDCRDDAYDLPEELVTEDSKRDTWNDWNHAIRQIQFYMKNLFKYLGPEDKERFSHDLLYRMVMTDHREYQKYIMENYEEITVPFVQRFEDFLESCAGLDKEHAAPHPETPHLWVDEERE